MHLKKGRMTESYIIEKEVDYHEYGGNKETILGFA